MPTWGQVEKELLKSRIGQGPPDFDGVRRRHLKRLAEYTGRSCIVYATNFDPPPESPPSDYTISLSPDVQAFMEVVHSLDKDVPLDLMLHSPGGSAEAAEAIIEYLRGRFPGLRVIVPVAAMSAATMMAMAADEIVMGAHSQLGPIDPQLTIRTPEGPRSAPAAAIREQFASAQRDLAKHPENIAAWLPIIRSMSPALLQLCEDTEALAKTMVSEWLERYMFADEAEAERKRKAERVANVLSDYGRFMSHSRRVSRDELRSMDLAVTDLEDDPELQDRVLTVHHCVDHTMNNAHAVKLVENHLGKAFVRSRPKMTLVGPVPGFAPPQDDHGPPPSRQVRRQQLRKGGGR